MKQGWAVNHRLESGQALVELVVISPILLILLAGVLQLSIMCQVNLLVHMAVRHAAEIHLQGGSEKQMQDEVSDYFKRYPFMEKQPVQVSLRTSFFMETVEVACQPPVLPYVTWLGQPPVARASMSLGRELLDNSRWPSIATLRQFREIGRAHV